MSKPVFFSHPVFKILLLVGGLGFLGLMALGFLAAMVGEHEFSFAKAPIVLVKIEGGIFDSEKTLKDLEACLHDRNVKALVVRIDSPGGAVAPSQEIFAELIKLKKAGKKIVVSMGTVAASGGYYIASAADKIVANPGTITGSIGVVMESFGLQDLAQILHVEPRLIKSGKMKDVGNPFRQMTDEEKIFLQKLSDNMYDQFLNDVSEQRQIPLEKLKVLAEGTIYSGQQAHELNLVDALGNVYDAIDLARREAGLPENAEVRWPAKPSVLENFFSANSENASLQNLLLKLKTRQWPVLLLPQGLTPVNQIQ